MKIRSIVPERASSVPGQYPPERLPEIAFLGRSNVGKSSLINSLLQRKKIARTSKTPGRTRAIHWYRVRGEGTACFFVDLPGYGYARVPRQVRQQEWGRLIETYLRSPRRIALAVQILDIRRDGPTALDLQMIAWLRDANLPTCFVLTKADKLSRAQQARAMVQFRRVLQPHPDEQLLTYSSMSGEGRSQLWAAIDQRVRAA